jgi:NAD(P)-dependent dehydrogenase (short-subunit alcohol dehydrogenase family)
MNSDPLFSVEDRVVVVTGGLGRLGQWFTATLLGRGAKVAILDIQTGPRTEALPTSENLLVLETDITKKDAIERAVATITKKWGAPSGLVNNAALDSPPGASSEENGPFESYPEASWDKVMEVNVKGVFLTCQVVGQAMQAAGAGAAGAGAGGSIVNICSIYGVVSPDQRLYEHRRKAGEPFFKPVAYSASKSALLNLTRYLATYWAEQKIRVNTMTLGGIFANQDKEFLRKYNAKVPLGRMAGEDDYTGALVFLLSDASRYMTGANLVVDGGFTAW